MATVRNRSEQTVADLLHKLGGIPASRVRLVPTPGTATETDVLRIHDRTDRLYELVDGVLVEKAMGFDESIYALNLAIALGKFLSAHDLGKVIGADGMVRLFPGLVRIPDVAFISWRNFPKSKRARGRIPEIAPDLVVEVLSKGNTAREMKRKLEEYFRSGVCLVWYVDPRRREVKVYTAVDRSITLTEDDHLDGAEVLPGFRLSIRDWFAEAERTEPR
jgi:Uma2 family endonuclease